MARDAISDTRDEMVYGGLYVTSQMTAIVSNNTRITLDAQTSCLIRRHACACTVSASLKAMRSYFRPPSCHWNGFHARTSLVLHLGPGNGVGMCSMWCGQDSWAVVGYPEVCIANFRSLFVTWSKSILLIRRLWLHSSHAHSTCTHAVAV